jgi:signal transduction histidine kinase
MASASRARPSDGAHLRGRAPGWMVALAAGVVGITLFPLLTPVDWLVKILAYGVFVAAVIVHYNRVRRQAVEAAVLGERTRIARDLHDGLAQDLAFIASHSTRLASDLGVEHPVTVAAKRALAISRGAMIDLAASTAPSTAAALEQVAHELENRFAVRVNVVVPEDPGPERAPREREEIVRIAREAIVNSVKHGEAGHVVVELGANDDELILRVCDDGSGIQTAAVRSGAGGWGGLSIMRARSASLGGRLVAYRRRDGGTEVKVLASSG